jgi:hypothetical protein
MEAFDRLRKWHHPIQTQFDQIAAATDDASFRAATRRLRSEFEYYVSLEEDVLFPILERHDLLRDKTVKLRQHNLELKRVTQALSESAFQSEQARISLARVHELVQQNFKVEETDLIPLAEKLLSPQEVKDANNAVARILSPNRVAAA